MTKPINIDEAIRHLTDKFDDSVHNRRSFKPTRYDVRCLNSIVEWRNRQRRESLNHILLSKLYVYLFTQFVIKFKTNNMQEAAKWMGRIFDRPLSVLVQDFMMFSNIYTQDIVLREAGLPEPSMHVPALRSDEENEKLEKAWEQVSSRVFEKLKEVKWDYEDALDLFRELISNALDVYSCQD